jgi:hypothetical protein
MYQTTITGFAEPSAHIAVNRNRLKHYDEKVYLKNGTHFEIELFNPKKNKVLVKIHLNGVPISNSGIVLLPGQRVFLERWLDVSKKFLFESYQVEDSKEAKAAIEDNGKVRVEFYDESVGTWTPSYYTTNDYSYLTPPPFGGTTINTLYSTTAPSSLIGGSSNTSSTSNSIETGRAERGETSAQSFGIDSSTYSMVYNRLTVLQLLPESAKPVEVQNIRNYCSNCGARVKNQNWKFCPTCGTKC